MTTFEDLGLSKNILSALGALGFEHPTAIQEEAIPYLIEDDVDMIGLAQTGTGKTAAFGLPLLHKLDPNSKHTQGLILAPTRELGKQIADQLAKFSKHMDRINVLPVYGGAAISNQIKALKKPTHVIIATPGRLIDLINRKAVKLANLRYLILDEADEMLNMGFKEDLDEILKSTPDHKNTWLFSATMPNEIKKIVDTYMNDPLEVKVNSTQKVNVNISHEYAVMHPNDKTEALARMLDVESEMRGVVFCRTKLDTQALAEKLLKRGYKADALHGDLSQQQRDRVMKRFRNHDLQVLIATDVAARGIDVDDITHVFHFTLPDSDEYYTHRSGRTARAGKKGRSIAFIISKDGHRIKRLERTLDIEFKRAYIPSNHKIADTRVRDWCFKVLGTKTKGKVDEKLMDKVHLVFGNLSKEEILTKLVVGRLDELGLGEDVDLNKELFEGGGGGRGKKGRKGGRSGRSGGRSSYRDRGGRSRDRGKRRSDKKKHRKGGGSKNR